MCGIVSYLGNQNALPLLLDGLQRLEYRGYDSAGIFIQAGDKAHNGKVSGKVDDLRKHFETSLLKEAHVGLGHTRWATHGKPNQINGHPHESNDGSLVLVHNGIIENYESLKTILIEKGYRFKSETDSEVLINWIQEIKYSKQLTLGEAVHWALQTVVGAYGIVVFDKTQPDTLVTARLGSPLVIGVGEDEYFVASDATPFIQHTRNVIYLNDHEIAILQKNKPIEVQHLKSNTPIDPEIEKLHWNLEDIQKGGYDHFMLKEIFEQPQAIKNTLRGRVNLEQSKIDLSSMKRNEDRFINATRIIILGCGTSWHAGLVGEYLIETLARIPVEVEYASEFRYRNPILYPTDIVIPISQSGETADTLAAVNIAKENGAFIYGICNVVGATIPRATDDGVYTHAGPEIGVASTKAFTSQVVVLIMMALKLARLKNALPNDQINELLLELNRLPENLETLLQHIEPIQHLAKTFDTATNCLYLGRGYNFPVALEGALKLKEISYIHAEGYPAAEMKHGPIALIDEEMPVIVIATKKGHYDKIVSNIQEIKSRKGRIIAIVSEGDETVKKLADHVIEIPISSEIFTPIYATLPLQLLSYYIAVNRNCNVDQPRNLAKSVTVE